MLTDEIKKAIKNEIEHIEIDVGLLKSYVYHPKKRDEDAWDEWSEEEEWKVKKETFIWCLEKDGLMAYLTDIDEDENETLTEQAIKYIEEDL